MNYKKINKIDIDGNGNITLQDVNGRDITVNYNDTAEIKKLIEKINDKQILEIKKLIASQDKFNKLLFDIASDIKKKDKKKKNLLGGVIVIFTGIIGVIALIKEKSLGNVEIPYLGILFFIALIPIIISFIVANKKREDKTYKPIILILFYSIVSLFIATSSLLFTSVFFNFPKKICEYPFVKCNEISETNPTTDTTTINNVIIEKDTSNSNPTPPDSNENNEQERTKIFVNGKRDNWNSTYIEFVYVNNKKAEWYSVNQNTIKFNYISSLKKDSVYITNTDGDKTNIIYIGKKDTITN